MKSYTHLLLAAQRARASQRHTTAGAAATLLIGILAVIQAPNLDDAVNPPTRPQRGDSGERQEPRAVAISGDRTTGEPRGDSVVRIEGLDRLTLPSTIQVQTPPVTVPTTPGALPSSIDISVHGAPSLESVISDGIQKSPVVSQTRLSEKNAVPAVPTTPDAASAPTARGPSDDVLLDAARDMLRQVGGGAASNTDPISLRVSLLILTSLVASWLAASARRHRQMREHYENAYLAAITPGPVPPCSEVLKLPPMPDAGGGLSDVIKSLVGR